MGIVITFLLIIALAFLGISSVSGAMMNAIDIASAAGKENGKVLTEKSLTSVDAISASYDTGGGHTWIIVKNDGHTDLGDWEKWDVFIHYRNPNPNNYMQFVRLTYSSTYPPGNNEWAKQGIYIDQAATIPEQYEPGRLNPGEYVKLYLKVSQSIKNNTQVYIKASTPNGLSDNIQYLK